LHGSQSTCSALHSDSDLPPQQANALHEKLVQVGREDTQETNPLKEGRSAIKGLRQNPAVELKPAEVAIQELEGLLLLPLGARPWVGFRSVRERLLRLFIGIGWSGSV
jgi:hypothetical protein